MYVLLKLDLCLVLVTFLDSPVIYLKTSTFSELSPLQNWVQQAVWVYIWSFCRLQQPSPNDGSAGCYHYTVTFAFMTIGVWRSNTLTFSGTTIRPAQCCSAAVREGNHPQSILSGKNTEVTQNNLQFVPIFHSTGLGPCDLCLNLLLF